MHGRRVSLTARQRRALIALLACACLAAPALGAQPTAAEEDGVGSVSARGTDPGAFWSPVGDIEAQLSAITNCDAAQSTRPFIVRWSAGGTTYTFRKTSVDNSSCFSDDSPEGARYDTVNEGDGQGTVNGSPATFSWRFTEGDVSGLPEGVSNDHAFVQIILKSGERLRLHIANPVGDDHSLNGTPGGVWAFGQLPWPRPAANAATVSAFDSLATIRSDRALPPGGRESAEISAAGNEFESFQLVVQAGSAPLRGVRVDPGQLLKGPGGATIPASNLTIYRGVDYKVSQPSDNEGGTGNWPDALIPERDTFYAENRNAFPIDLAPGQKLAAWIDVLVPDRAPAGDYTGSIVVRGGGGTVAELPIHLTVYAFSIPSTSSLQSSFAADPGRLCEAHFGSYNCNSSDPSSWRLHALYVRAGLENRISIPNGFLRPSSTTTRTLFAQHAAPLIQGTDASIRLRGAELTALSASPWCINAGNGCLQNWKDAASQYGFSSRFFAYLCDEPSADASVWPSCASTAQRADQVWPGVRKLVTTSLQDAQGNGGGWSGALSYTDLLTPVINNMIGGGGSQRPSYNSFLDPGNNAPGTASNELWLYASCMSHSCDASEDPPGTQSRWSGWPGYAIDAPPSQARAMGWMTFLYRATGELYWDTTVSLPHAWTSQYVAGGNGDGTLFYPGTPVVVGGTHPIPVESMRLKRIRDGREDYEYLRILAARGQRPTATEVVTDLFGSPSVAMRSTTLNPVEMNKARGRLAAAISG